MRNAFAIAVAAAGLLLAGGVQAQSLGELAAKERAKREAEQKKKPVKTYTDDDLGSGAGSNTSIMSEPETTSGPATPATGATGAGGSEAQKTEDQLRAERQNDWRGKLDVARKNEANLKTNIDQVQLDINDMSGGVYSARRTTMLKVLEEQKQKLADTQKQIADLEDEGRRLGYR